MTELATAAPTQREIPLEFRATGGEYFRIWIVNLLLSIVTLGIYSAWAKVRRMRYFYGSTSLEGSSFEYHGRPIAILKGRLIAFGIYILFIVLSRLSPLFAIPVGVLIFFGVPWVVVRARLFQMRMSSWRGLRFNFHGTYGGAFAAVIGWTILAIVTLGILFPLTLWKQVNYLLGNSAYGSQRFEFTSTRWSFYRFFLIGLAITLGVIVAIVVIVIIVFAVGGFASAASSLPPGATPEDVARLFKSGGMIGVFAVAMFIYVAGLMVVSAWFASNLLNASVGGVQIGPHRVYSRLATWPMWGILVTNLLGMIVTLGLFYPWAKVRMLRYQLAHTGIIADGDLTRFASDGEQPVGAVGEEVADFFDIDFGF
ncbi:MAG: YjgN family protein [Pseudomonadota bacterium]